MKVQVYPDYKSLSRATADLISTYIKKKPSSLICLASGHSPLGVFNCMVDDVKSGKLNLDHCTFVSLDEWIGIPASQKGSCREMMDKDFFGPLAIKEHQIIFFDGMAKDLKEEVDKVNRVIEANNGLDIMLVGVGMNGHIAMNEPGTSFDSVAHVSTLAEETKTVGQKYFDTATQLSQGITLGLKHFRNARLPILMANGEKKASIIRRILASAPSESLPASVVQLIDHGIVMLDEAADSAPD
jgi:glucosamine-6-phosphate isomerase